MLPNFIARRPVIAENDFSGIIANSNNSHWKNGDAVFGWFPTGDPRVGVGP